MNEIARCEHDAYTHHYDWQEVGCKTWDWQRIDTLYEILKERRDAQAQVERAHEEQHIL